MRKALHVSRKLSIEHQKEIERILRVDHAGELGAINIYRAQLSIAKLFYKDMVPELRDMLAHEKEHFSTFNKLLLSRSVRSCYALWFWALGGFILGLFTGLVGRNAIWVCTNAIESTVLHHLEWQLNFLQKHDLEAYNAVHSIKADEEAHQKLGEQKGTNARLYSPIFFVVKGSTKYAIWLSTKL